MTPKTNNKYIFLEGARGIASVIVIFHHFFLAFLPGVKSVAEQDAAISLRDTPFYWLINGQAAVAFFFVLSGFVLTAGFFRNPDQQALLISALKRGPRLALPAGLSILCGFLILNFGLNFNVEAAAYSDSGWLRSFANAHFPEGFSPSILSAALQSVTVFITGDTYYNTNLWTMRPELVGSFLVFGLAWALVFSIKGRYTNLIFLALIGVLAFTIKILVPFVLGAYLAFHLHRLSKPMPTWIAAVLIVISLACFCFENIALQCVGSVLVIISLLGCDNISRHLSGKVGYWLGKISFPIYLVHTLVICSVSSYVFATLLDDGYALAHTLMITAFVTLAATFVASVPFIILEGVWVPWLNKFTKSVFNSTYNYIKR